MVSDRGMQSAYKLTNSLGQKHEDTAPRLPVVPVCPHSFELLAAVTAIRPGLLEDKVHIGLIAFRIKLKDVELQLHGRVRIGYTVVKCLARWLRAWWEAGMLKFCPARDSVDTYRGSPDTGNVI